MHLFYVEPGAIGTETLAGAASCYGSCSGSGSVKLMRLRLRNTVVDGNIPVMGTHSFISYFLTVTVTSLVTAITNKFLFSSACDEVTEAIGDLKND
jgi:hypothetical protein